MTDRDLLFSEDPATTPVDIVFGFEPGVALVFVDPPAGNPFNIVFGGVSGGTADSSAIYLDAAFSDLSFVAFVAPPVIASVDGTFDALSVTGLMREVYEEDLTGSFPAMSFSGSVTYISDTERPTVAKCAAPWARSLAGDASLTAAYRASMALPSGVEDDYRGGALTPLSIDLSYASMLNGNRPSVSGLWRNGVQRAAGTRTTTNQMLRTNRPVTVNIWRNGVQHAFSAGDRFDQMLPIPRPAIAADWRGGSATRISRKSKAGVAEAVYFGLMARWRAGITPPIGTSTIAPPVTPPKPPCYPIPDGNAVYLIFKDAPGGSELVFVCDGHSAPSNPGTIIVPIKRTYMVINDIQLIRVDGNIALDAKALSLNIDQDSWTWSFNATLPASSLRNLQPGAAGDQVQLRAIINGSPYLLIVESVARDRQFGSTSITVSGRGHNAILSSPYTQLMTFTNAQDSTAQQLMLDVLTINGISIGWDIDWQIGDWLVPAGAWNHQGDYITAVNAIAGAAGAFVQPDPVNQILRILPRYPVAPWDWYSSTTVPDFQLPSAAMRKESISWATQPDYNSVYVSGSTAGGILAHVTRAGTAGDLVAQMITDALITDSVAARQRALPVLAYTGAIQDYSLSLPILKETGIINPGKIVAYVDDGVTVVGLVKGVSISSQLPSATQVIEVEVHG
jgi:hypothetical protein